MVFFSFWALEGVGPSGRAERRNSTGIKGLGKLAFKPVDANTGAVKLAHNEAVSFNEIAHGFLFVLDSFEPLMLIHVTLDNFFLGVQDVMQMFAFIKHNRSHRPNRIP
jgi:hypothetical protein